MEKKRNLIEEWKTSSVNTSLGYKKIKGKISNMNAKKLSIHAEEIHESVFKLIDCLDCANCCKKLPPIINETDAKRIAKYLSLKITDFKIKYVKYDEDDDMVLNQTPCVFLLQDNKCLIYDVRPKSCREYPHTGNNEFVKNKQLHIINARYCPAVFHILDQL